jgi:glycosyltransferase involved in cell wall biosynthesis
MRVALVSMNAPAWDAIGNSVAEKFAFFRERAGDVRVFVESAQRLHPALAGQCQVVPDAEPQGEFWDFLRSADLVCVEFGQYYSLLSLVPLLAGGKPRILIDYHSVTPPKFWPSHNREALTQGQAYRGLAWCADLSVAHSHFTKDELVSHTGLPADRVQVLGLPVERQAFSAGPDRRGELGLEGCQVLLFVGRLAPNKRPALLVEALGHLRDLAPPVHAVFVGDAGDLYQAEAQRCLDRASELGLSERVHMLGMLPEARLAEIYRSADLLVAPSVWEGFCVPVVEAMASGLPVVAARAAGLPETVASAGLTFKPDDAWDLARQVRQVLDPTRRVPSPVADVRSKGKTKIAIVSARFGDDFAGGAEASLGKIALALEQAGHTVEVFATCSRQEGGGRNELPAGTTACAGLLVHRYPVEPGTTHSPALLTALESRLVDFEYVLTGPYLSNLTGAVCQLARDKTILLPCFHDEPAVRLREVPEHCHALAGIWYHSAAEQALAERVFGVNHTAASAIGTHLNMDGSANPDDGQATVGGSRYAVYCGRFCAEKNLPLLFDLARQFDTRHRGELRFAFLGQGGLPIPSEPWALNLGFVPQPVQQSVLAGAVALIQLSTNESLSLVALQAWAVGTPVIAHRRSAVLADHIERCGGGFVVENYAEFEAALEVLSVKPEIRKQLGERGKKYVAENYGSSADFASRLTSALEETRRPLIERMRLRGLQRAAAFDREAWRQAFGTLVEGVLHAPPRKVLHALRIEPRLARCTAQTGNAILAAVRVFNEGTEPALPAGPARTVLAGEIVDAAGIVVQKIAKAAALPGLLQPGGAVSASISLVAPAAPGAYSVRIWAQSVGVHAKRRSAIASFELTVGAESQPADGGCSDLLAEVNSALAEADGLRALPDNYLDVTQGAFSGFKSQIKQKLLGNFKKAYVDVLSRQQTQCNSQLLAAVQTLAECCATLDHALHQLQQRVARLELARHDNTFTESPQPADRTSPGECKQLMEEQGA